MFEHTILLSYIYAFWDCHACTCFCRFGHLQAPFTMLFQSTFRRLLGGNAQILGKKCFLFTFWFCSCGNWRFVGHAPRLLPSEGRDFSPDIVLQLHKCRKVLGAPRSAPTSLAELLLVPWWMQESSPLFLSGVLLRSHRAGIMRG